MEILQSKEQLLGPLPWSHRALGQACRAVCPCTGCIHLLTCTLLYLHTNPDTQFASTPRVDGLFHIATGTFLHFQGGTARLYVSR